MGKDKDTYYPKYIIIRRSNAEILDPTTCFTLVPERDPHAKVALKAYADSCEDDAPGLAAALRAHFEL